MWSHMELRWGLLAEFPLDESVPSLKATWIFSNETSKRTLKLRLAQIELCLDIPSMPWDIFSQEEPWMRSLKREWDLLLFSSSVVSSSLQPHGLQLSWLPCPPLSTGVYSDSCPLSQWCHPTVSPSATRFSFCLQSSPASGSSSVSWLFTSGG